MKFGRYEKSEKSTVGTAVTFLMIGLGVGATIALLLAPKSGRQLRRDLRRGYDDARDTLQDWSDEAQERLKEVADAAQDRLRGVADRSAEWADELREAARPIAKAIRRD
jgi:gas vesicle protein